jgi:putative zinc-dependent peptidase DUF5700
MSQDLTRSVTRRAAADPTNSSAAASNVSMPFNRMLFQLAILPSLAALSACAGRSVSTGVANARPLHGVDVTLVTDEVDAALSIIQSAASGETPSARQWSALFGSQGYAHLKEREAAMGRAFTDSSFAQFLTRDSVTRRLPAMQRAIQELEHADVATAARMARAYLPPGTPMRARLYLEIKPHTNSFVFTGRDSVPSIFIYVNTAETAAQLNNTLAHELHHIGTAAACQHVPGADSTHTTPAERMLLEYLTAFGEGRAMLAAAGSPDVHPHATDADSIRARWDRDVAHAPEDIADLSGFIEDVNTGRIATADSVQRRGNSYFGVQGAWYTVGWLMAATVEREEGRDALIGTLCNPVDFLSQYNRAAQQSNSTKHTRLPLWPAPLIDTLSRIARPAPM